MMEWIQDDNVLFAACVGALVVLSLVAAMI
jgi:hypothetical protein